MSGRAVRSTSILGGVALAAIALMSWSQTWFVVGLTGQSASHPDLTVAGDVSAPAVAALAVAAAAAVVAMAISGRFFRVVLALLVVAVGVSIVLSATLALTAPAAAVEPTVTQVTSISGADSVAAIIGSLTASAWPFVALVTGVLLALLGIAIILTSHLWPKSGRRYETARQERVKEETLSPGDNSVSDWDELSDGTDPTSR